MTKNQIEGSRIKIAARLNEISGLEGGDAFTDAIRAEASTLETEYRDSGVKLQAALVVEDAERQVAEREAAELGSLAGDPEQRERLELRGRARFGRFLASAISGRAVDGVEAEYRSSMGTWRRCSARLV